MANSSEIDNENLNLSDSTYTSASGRPDDTVVLNTGGSQGNQNTI